MLFGGSPKMAQFGRLGDNIDNLTSTTHDGFAAAEQLNRFSLEAFEHNGVLNHPVGRNCQMQARLRRHPVYATRMRLAPTRNRAARVGELQYYSAHI